MSIHYLILVIVVARLEKVKKAKDRDGDRSEEMYDLLDKIKRRICVLFSVIL